MGCLRGGGRLAVSAALDCRACGACCAYSADWPRLLVARDRGPEGPPPDLRTADGYLRCEGRRCLALRGSVGEGTSCAIYARRPQSCRDCEAGSVSCLVARRFYGLAVPEAESGLEGLGVGGAGKWIERLDFGDRVPGTDGRLLSGSVWAVGVASCSTPSCSSARWRARGAPLSSHGTWVISRSAWAAPYCWASPRRPRRTGSGR